MKKILSLILLSVSTLTILTGCSINNNKVETKNINVVIPDGITAIASAKLIEEDKEILKGYDVDYSIESSPENIVSSVLKKEADIAIVPSNVAATQYNKDAGYVIAGTIGWGSFYLVSTDGEKDINKLLNKEVYNIGKGLTPDLTVRSLLKDNNIDADKDVNFSYVNGVTELAPLVLSGKVKYAVMPEPAISQVMKKNNNVAIISDLNEEWKKTNDSEYGYPQSTLIIKKELVEEDKEFVNKFIEDMEESCEFAASKNEKLPDYSEEIGVSTDKAVVLEAMDRANIRYTPIKDCYKEYEIYFNKLDELDPKTIGGKVPDEGIFMEK
ncbi:NitT/TauT family transport system substrate-binding protein [Clostridium sp. DSM 8431]|uniref:ABC transporter substrate-binding protein n=1 Tax=Clostridium sp. DSM 8431 TaxID=1761781 RepID=UPI0008EF5EB2|nr:ABC transporter substrate-binding protein [Clostridium sp. DSM 8431]SFU41062.1 NitT/TauT family transport system substrate-binding protein [Clostridium sp. DSM 8431]